MNSKQKKRSVTDTSQQPMADGTVRFRHVDFPNSAAHLGASIRREALVRADMYFARALSSDVPGEKIAMLELAGKHYAMAGLLRQTMRVASILEALGEKEKAARIKAIFKGL